MSSIQITLPFVCRSADGVNAAILRLPADIGLSRGPLFVDLDEDCGCEAKKGCWVLEDPDGSGPSLEFLLNRPLHWV